MNFFKKFISLLIGLLLGGLTLFGFVLFDRIFGFSLAPESSYGFWGIVVPLLVVFIGYWVCNSIFQCLSFFDFKSPDRKKTKKYIGSYSNEKSSIQKKSKNTEVKRNNIHSADDLNNVHDRMTNRVPKIGDQIEVYSYIKTPVTLVDRDALLLMYHEKSFKVIPTVSEDGYVWLYNELSNSRVAKLNACVDMCKDWLRRGDTIRCEFTGFKKGHEHVVLAFYRNEYERLKKYNSVVVKLFSYRSEYAQGSISLMVSGEKLSCSGDEYTDGKVNVLDNCDESIGRLPQKYSDIYNDQGFAGIFFDHADEDNNYKLVPYVRIFLY